MTQVAELEFPQIVTRERSFEECSPSLPVAGLPVGPSRTMGTLEARDRLSASLWVTSLQRPRIFEVVPTENIISGSPIDSQSPQSPQERTRRGGR